MTINESNTKEAKVVAIRKVTEKPFGMSIDEISKKILTTREVENFIKEPFSNRFFLIENEEGGALAEEMLSSGEAIAVVTDYKLGLISVQLSYPTRP